jgi:hypothetical protein
MARELVKTVRTITRRSGAEGDAAQGKLRAALRHVARLTAPGYVEAVKKADLSDLSLHVFKKLGVGHMGKCGEYALHEVEPETIEANIMQAWGPGMYQLRPVLNNMYYPPSSVMFKISDGEEEPSTTAAPGKDVEAVIAETTRNLGNLAVAKKFKELSRDAAEDTDVNQDRMVALIAALKPDNAVMIELLRQADARAERAERDRGDMMRLLMEQRSGAQAGALPILGDLLKNVKPEVWQTLLNPAGPEPAGGWVELVREVAGAIGPALRDILPHVAPLLMSNLKAAGVPVRAPALPDGSRQVQQPPAATPEPGAGGGTMPVPLTEEQEYSKTMILDFVKANDMENAFAALVAFPGMAPGPHGPMPMGDFIISRVDPGVNPRVYVPQLLMLFPELKTMLPAAEAFVRYIQNKIVKDEEAALAEERTRGGADEPAPTREGER